MLKGDRKDGQDSSHLYSMNIQYVKPIWCLERWPFAGLMQLVLSLRSIAIAMNFLWHRRVCSLLPKQVEL